MNLAAMTTVALAQANDQPASTQDARQPPTEGQVGEAWRHPQVAAEQPTADDTRRPPTEAQVGEPWRHPTTAPVPPAAPSGQPGWLLPSLGVLAAVLVLAGGLAVLADQAGRPQGSGRARGLTTVTPLDGAAAPTRQPHHLAGDKLRAYLASGQRTASVRWSGWGCNSALLGP